MKNSSYMKEADYSVFEFSKNIITFSQRLSVKKWKAKIRSELEKLYPNFDSFTLWYVKNIYSLCAKKIIVIVVEPEIYASYRMKNKKVKIIYKGKKYNLASQVIKIFFTSIVIFAFFILFLSMNCFNQKNINSQTKNTETIEKENTAIELPLCNYISFYTFLDYFSQSNTKAHLKKLFWELDKNNEEKLEVLLSNVYPEELESIFQTDKCEKFQYDVLSITYQQNIPEVLVSSTTNTLLYTLQDVDIKNFRKIINEVSGEFIKETNDRSFIQFFIPKTKIQKLLNLVKNARIIVQSLEIENNLEGLYISVGLSNKGINLANLLSCFAKEEKLQVQRQVEPIVKKNEPENAIYLGSVIGEEGQVNKYFKNNDNKIIIVGY